MLRNYLTATIRNFWKYPGYSLINIVGLSVGIASYLLLLIVVQFETSHDTFYPDGERLYKVVRSTRTSSGGPEYTFRTFGPLGPVLEETFPEVESAVRLFMRYGFFRHNEKMLSGRICVTDPAVFDVFNFDIVAGDPETVFAEPFAIFVTESTAKRFFGDEDPMGKTLTISERYLPGDFVIRGIIRDHPANSHIRFDALTATVPKNRHTDQLWGMWRPQSNSRQVATYVKLRAGADPGGLESKLSQIVETYMGSEWVDKIGYELMPLQSVWLYARQDFGIGSYGDISLLYTIGIIAGSILMIACINYVNLATARSQRRALEVGLRKVVGANRPQIALQFLGESVLVACLATGFGIVVAWMFLPTFNDMTNLNITFDILNPMAITGLFVVVAGVGVLSGLYPAFIFSSFAPTVVLKGAMSRTREGIWLRRTLVIVQFGISVILGVCILVMDKQMAFIANKALGFNPKNILAVSRPFDNRPDLQERLKTLRKEFGRHPSILSSTGSRSFPGMTSSSNIIWIPDGAVQTEYRAPLLPVDEDFLKTYEMPLISGRNFSEAVASDSIAAYILTESATKIFGWDNEQAIGQLLTSPYLEGTVGRPRGRVIGVIKDFHLNPLHRAIQPVVLMVWNRQLRNFSLRYREGEREAVVAHVERLWKHYEPNRPPEYYDLEDMHGWAYRRDYQLIQTSRVSGLIALIIACLGLLGLTAFTIQQRIQEVAVRKILGASAFSLVRLLAKEVVSLVILANVFAAPVGYWLVTQWLAAFPYRVGFGVTSFLYLIFLTLLIAMVTIGYQTFCAVRTDPVKMIRTE